MANNQKVTYSRRVTSNPTVVAVPAPSAPIRPEAPMSVSEQTRIAKEALKQEAIQALLMGEGNAVPVTGNYYDAIRARQQVRTSAPTALTNQFVRGIYNQRGGVKSFAAANYNYPSQQMVTGAALAGMMSPAEARRHQMAALMGLGAAPPNLPAGPSKSGRPEQEWIDLWCRWMFPANPPPPGEEAFGEELQERCRTGKKCGWTGCGAPWSSSGAYQREIPKLEFNVDMPGTAGRIKAFEKAKELAAQVEKMKADLVNRGTSLVVNAATGGGGSAPPAAPPPAANSALRSLAEDSRRRARGVNDGVLIQWANKKQPRTPEEEALAQAAVKELQRRQNLAPPPATNDTPPPPPPRTTPAASNTGLIVGGVAAVAAIAYFATRK